MQRSKKDINQLFFSFLIRLAIVTLIVIILFVALVKFGIISLPSQSIPIFVVLFAVTAGIHYILLRAGRGEATQFASFIILSVVIKLFLYAIFTFLLIVSDRPGAMANVLLFFSVYIIVTVFEISMIYRHVDRSN